MECKQPVIWKAVCQVCGKEVCRFCSEPDKDCIKLNKGVPGHALAYKYGRFDRHPANFCNQYVPAQPGMCDYEADYVCCTPRDVEIISEPWTNIDLFNFMTELTRLTESIDNAAHGITQLRKYIDGGKINKESFDVMYTNIIAIMHSMKQLTKERLTIEYLKEDLSSDVNF